jgi:hypothetical protein
VPDDILLPLVALFAGGAGIASVVALLRLALPVARRMGRTVILVRQSYDTSRDRLIDSLQEERVELDRQLDQARAERDAARAEVDRERQSAADAARAAESRWQRQARREHQLRNLCQVMLDMAPGLRLSDALARMDDPPVMTVEYSPRDRDDA